MAGEKIYESDDQGVHYIVPADRATGLNAETGAARREHTKPEREACSDDTGLAGSPAAKRPDNTWTIGRLWAEYQAANPGLKGMSIYRAIYNAHLSQPFGDGQPADISPFDLDRLKLDGMKGRSPKSIANALELLRRIINFGVRRGLCPGPRFRMQLPRVDNEKTEDLTGEELSRLVAVLERHIERRTPHAAGAAMMKLALLTGMRRGEIFRLQWPDLDFHRGNILLREPKGGRNVIIPMSSHTRLLLESLGRWRDTAGGDYVFPGKDGGRRRDVRAQVNAIKAEAGLPADFRPLHGLRHVFASGLVSAGVEFQIVQRLLTHKGGTVTHRYAHIRDDALRMAADLVGDLINPPSGQS